jgi:hypothetical protein
MRDSHFDTTHMPGRAARRCINCGCSVLSSGPKKRCPDCDHKNTRKRKNEADKLKRKRKREAKKGLQ